MTNAPSSAGQSPDTPEPLPPHPRIWWDGHDFLWLQETIDHPALYRAQKVEDITMSDGPVVELCAAPSVDPDTLARALHDADCGCGDYDEVEDDRYIQAVRAALAAPGLTSSPAIQAGDSNYAARGPSC